MADDDGNKAGAFGAAVAAAESEAWANKVQSEKAAKLVSEQFENNKDRGMTDIEPTLPHIKAAKKAYSELMTKDVLDLEGALKGAEEAASM